jgi:hypothetical protein
MHRPRVPCVGRSDGEQAPERARRHPSPELHTRRTRGKLVGIGSNPDDAPTDTRELGAVRVVGPEGSARNSLSLEDAVKGHVSNFLAKVDANDRPHAVTLVIRRGAIHLQRLLVTSLRCSCGGPWCLAAAQRAASRS